MSSSKVAHMAGNNAHAPWSRHAGHSCLICEASLFEASEEACCHGHLSPASGAQIKFYMCGMTKWQEPWLQADDRSPSSGQCQPAHIYKRENENRIKSWKSKGHIVLCRMGPFQGGEELHIIPQYFLRHWKLQTFPINFVVKYSCILVWAFSTCFDVIEYLWGVCNTLKMYKNREK